MKKRRYTLISAKVGASTPALVTTYNNIDLTPASGEAYFSYVEKEITSDDIYEGELCLMAFDIKEMHRIDEALRHLGYHDDLDHFYAECREVVARPERHINEKGEGKLSFQSYFHNVPYSLQTINDTAIVIVALRPFDQYDANGLQMYEMVCYIHLNKFNFQVTGQEKLTTGYYYNMLRVNERAENGVKLYRRKRIFICIINIVYDLSILHQVDYNYAAIGRENQAINNALDVISDNYGRHYERFPFSVYSKFNFVLGRRKAAQQLIDITDNELMLKQFYQKIKDTYSREVFFKYHSEATFLHLIQQIKSYSKSSRVYMLADNKGQLSAALIAMNWGDYFSLVLENAKGLIKTIAGMTERILYPFLAVGSPKAYQQLLQGVAYHYRKNHQVALTFLVSHPGDPYYKIKKSLISDDYLYYTITLKKEEMQAMKKYSEDEAGHARIFTGLPII